jgi:CRISP-associated protein Cas1
MSENRILLIENPAQLRVKLDRLCIHRDGFDDAFILPNDIAVLVIHHPVVSLTAAVMQALTKAGAILLVTDERHLPTGMLWPWVGQDRLAGRLRQQIRLENNPSYRDDLWANIVRSRLETQALNLKYLEKKGSLRLKRLVTQVTSGDPNNLEAQGARHYWKILLPEGVRREKRGASDAINSRLNYGYAVLRAMVARELACHGLQPALGLGHSSGENPFNLADDFMECFRFCVERFVMRSNLSEPFDSNARVRLLDFVKAEVTINGKTFRLPSAIAETVNGFVRVLTGTEKVLPLPGL